MLEIGKTYLLSELRVEDCGEIRDENNESGGKFIVIKRIPEDRTSGSSLIQFTDGSSFDFSWDRINPKVKFRGKGEIRIKII